MTTTTLGKPSEVDGDVVLDGTDITGRCDGRVAVVVLWGVFAVAVGITVLVPDVDEDLRSAGLGERGGITNVSGRISMIIFPARGGDFGCGRAGMLAVLSRRLTFNAEGARD